MLWGPPFGGTGAHTARVVEKLSSAICDNYGHAGPRLVRYLMDHAGEWERWRADYREAQDEYARAAGGDAVAGRLSTYLAALRVTAEIAHDAFGFSWAPRDPIDAVVEDVITEGVDADRAATALSHVVSYARSREHAFYGRHEKYEGTPRAVGTGWLGKWEKDDGWKSISFYPHSLRETLAQGGFDAEATLRIWSERGWLNTGTDRSRRTMKVRVDGASEWLIVVRRDAIERVEGT